MPYYIYSNPETGETKDVFQKMNDVHEYFDETGLQWNRVFTVPNAGIDTVKLNPFSSKDFLKKTDKAGTIGSIMDRSKEMSEKRKDKEGFDPLQKRYFKDWSKARGGRRHSEEIKQDLKTKGFIE